MAHSLMVIPPTCSRQLVSSQMRKRGPIGCGQVANEGPFEKLAVHTVEIEDSAAFYSGRFNVPLILKGLAATGILELG